MVKLMTNEELETVTKSLQKIDAFIKNSAMNMT